MFDFLKKPTHHHPNEQKLTPKQSPQLKNIESPLQSMDSFNVSIAPQLNSMVQNKTNKKASAHIKKYQQNSVVHLSRQVQNQLKGMLIQSQRLLNHKTANEIIKKQMQTMQKRAFTRYTATNEQDYLYKLFDKAEITHNLVQSLNDLISGTVSNIADDIQNDRHNYEVFKKKILTKQEIKDGQKSNQLHSIKIKEGQIASKVGQLRMEINIMEDKNVISKAKQIVQKDNFGKQNQKTKQIQKFIQQKKLQRQQIQRKKKQDLQRKKLKQLQEKVIVQKQIQKAKSQRHAKLVQKYQDKQMQKQRRNQQVQSQKQKFAKFLKDYKKAKPLYQQKIQEQIKRQIQDRKLRFQQMSQRKGKYNPISFDELQSFQAKYLELKRQQDQKKQIQMAMRKQEQHYRIEEMRDKHYKGKYRYFVLQEMVNRQAKAKQQEFAKKLMIQKKRAYSVDIKQKYKPRIDQNKRIESENFVIQSQKKSKQKGPKRVRLNSSDSNNLNTINYEIEQEEKQLDPKKQGQKYRRLFKQYIHDKIQRGQIKKAETLQTQRSSFTPKIDYLKEKRQNRQTKQSSFSYQSLDAQSRIRKIKNQSNGDVALFKLKAQQFDQKAKRQQLRLKYSDHNPNDEKELQQNYLASIKAKLQLLNNIK